MNFKTVDEIRQAIAPVAESMGVEIVDLEWKLGADPALTVFIETEDGVDLDTCAAFNNAVDPVLEEFDPTFGVPYTLNISSPGLDRPFKTERDFARNIGSDVEIKLYAPIRGKKFLEGTLADFDESSVTIETPQGMQKLERSKIAKINKAIGI